MITQHKNSICRFLNLLYLRANSRNNFDLIHVLNIRITLKFLLTVFDEKRIFKGCLAENVVTLTKLNVSYAPRPEAKFL